MLKLVFWALLTGLSTSMKACGGRKLIGKELQFGRSKQKDIIDAYGDAEGTYLLLQHDKPYLVDLAIS